MAVIGPEGDLSIFVTGGGAAFFFKYNGFHYGIHVHIAGKVIGFVKIQGVVFPFGGSQMNKVDAFGKTGKHDRQVIVGPNPEGTRTKGNPVGANRTSIQQLLQVGGRADYPGQTQEWPGWIIGVDAQVDATFGGHWCNLLDEVIQILAQFSVTNLGVRPTVDGMHRRLETHLLDFPPVGHSGDLYGQPFQLAFVAHLRPEQRFSGLDALVAQIHADIAQARDLLAFSPAV